MKIHQILTSNELTYEFYLSIVSALEVHKPEEHILWTIDPVDEISGYIDFVKDKITIKQVTIDFSGCTTFAEWQALPAFSSTDNKHYIESFNDNFSRVHLKDVLAWKILFDEGGLFMDLDTLSIQDCTPFFDNCENVFLFKHGVDNRHPEISFNIAVMMAQPQTPLMWEIYNKSQEAVLGDEHVAWGVTGDPPLFSVIGPLLADNDKTMFSYLDEFCVVDGNGLGRIEEYLSDNGFVWDQCRILHLYRSSDYVKAVLNGKALDENFIFNSKSPYARLVKTILRPQQWNPKSIRQPNNTVQSAKTFHIPCLQHLPATKKDSLSCAFTQKTTKLATMMKSLGHKVIAYGIEGSEVDCDEFVQVATKYELEQSLGKRTDLNKFYNLQQAPIHNIFNNNAIREINSRKQPHDFLLCTYGWGHKPIADGVKIPLTVESGIGYPDTFATYKVFESSAWMHYQYGKTGQINGANYDCIIPNYFEVDDFEYSEEKDDYVLYMGRLIGRKGIDIAIEATKYADIKLKVAGQDCGENIKLDSPHVEYVGFADVETRKQLFSRAKALLVPTKYIGPFEGVHVEAGLSGTPVITSAWGVFHETVLHGKTGFRCRTLDQYVNAIHNIDEIKPIDCYNYSVQNYGMEHVKWMYEEYFDSLLDIAKGKGWYAIYPNRGSYRAWERTFPN